MRGNQCKFGQCRDSSSHVQRGFLCWRGERFHVVLTTFDHMRTNDTLYGGTSPKRKERLVQGVIVIGVLAVNWCVISR